MYLPNEKKEKRLRILKIVMTLKYISKSCAVECFEQRIFDSIIFDLSLYFFPKRMNLILINIFEWPGVKVNSYR